VALSDSLNREYPRPEWVKEGLHTFNTSLPLRDEISFNKWVMDNNVPFDPRADVSDYDMRGFWQALQAGDERATSAINPNDGKPHWPDYWKTPYHETFSSHSQWANETAPQWNEQDQLVGLDGAVLFDERAMKR
jgi:hypothetical protein